MDLTEAERLKQFEPSVREFTVFCRESADTGTRWVDSVEVTDSSLQGSALFEHLQEVAVRNCAVNWGWKDSSGITCYCIIPGEPGILYFGDLGDSK